MLLTQINPEYTLVHANFRRRSHTKKKDHDKWKQVKF